MVEPVLDPVFRHGIASGDPAQDRVVIWTRVSHAGDGAEPVPVTWVLADDPGLTATWPGHGRGEAERDWTVHVDVEGLEPGRHYWYRFEALGAATMSGAPRRCRPTTSPR